MTDYLSVHFPFFSMHDIRLCTPTKNTLVFAQDPPTTVLAGHVVFSLLQPASLTAVSLTLVGTLRIRTAETFVTRSGQRLATVPSTSSTPLFTAHWENLLSSSVGTIGTAPPVRQSTPLESSFSLYFNSEIPVGSTPFPESTHATYHLPSGNYSLPFRISVSSDIPVSLITPNADITYIFKSTIHTLSPSLPSTTFKHINLVKTLSSLQLAQNEEYLSENSWSGKLQYKITIPQKNIPIGSNLYINLLIIPIIKGLKLGKLAFQIAQLTKFPDLVDERIIYSQSFPNLQSNQLSNDSWALKVRLPVPNDLSNISPTTISSNKYYEIRHKLIIFINLINVDGHISQIKSKILLNFYINKDFKVFSKKFCKVKSNNDEYRLYGKKLLFTNDIINGDENENRNGNGNENETSNGDWNPNFTQLPPELLIFPNNEFNSNEGEVASTFNNNNNNDNNTNTLPHSNELSWDIPPSYRDSKNDVLFTNIEEIPSHSNCSSFTSLNSNLGSNHSFQSLNSNNSFNNLDTIPCYNSVYDDDVLNIGEPTPLYTKRYHDFNTNFNSNPNSNPNSTSNSSLRINLLSRGVSRSRSRSNSKPQSPNSASNPNLNNNFPRFYSYLNKNHNHSLPHTHSLPHSLGHHTHNNDGDSSDSNSLINV